MKKSNLNQIVSFSFTLALGALLYASSTLAATAPAPAPAPVVNGPDKPATGPNPSQMLCMSDCRELQRELGQKDGACLFIPGANQVKDLNENVWNCVVGPNNIQDPYQSGGDGGSSDNCKDPYQSGC